MTPARPPAAKLDLAAAASVGGVYAGQFLARGVVSPFLPLWLHDRGCSALAISAVLASTAFLGLVLGPLLAMACDAFAWRKSGLAAAAALTSLAFAILGFGSGGFALALAVFAVAACQAQLPLADVLATSAAREAGVHYGAFRGVGTAAYMLASLAGGWLIQRRGSGVVAGWCLFASLAGLAAALMLPRREWARSVRAGPHVERAPLAALLLDRRFLAVLLATGLVDGSHAYFYGFSSVIWRARGWSVETVGGLRALAALAEVAFLFGLEPWTRRIPPWSLLAAAGAAAAARWTGMALSPPLAVEAGLQLLHAFSFTLMFVAALRLVEAVIPPHRFALGQATCAAVLGGVVPGVGLLVGGALFAGMAQYGYLVMAAVALAGVGAAFSLPGSALRRRSRRTPLCADASLSRVRPGDREA